MDLAALGGGLALQLQVEVLGDPSHDDHESDTGSLTRSHRDAGVGGGRPDTT